MTTSDTNFGLAQIKREGYISEYSTGVSCPSFSKALHKKLAKLPIPFYLWPFKQYIHVLYKNAWQSALLEQVKHDPLYTKKEE